MKTQLLIPGALMLTAAAALGADSAVITVTNDFAGPRPAEVITIPFAELRKVVPELQMHHFRLRDQASGTEAPSQVMNFEHDHHGINYDDVVFQHDFAAGEREARFLVEKSEAPVPPYAARVFARVVPERFDDMAWENDRLGHRMYGPALDSAAAAAVGERLRGSGIDVWGKRVRYMVVDRWYKRGHDQFHADFGEGLDLYSVGQRRGTGGTGIWDGKQLFVSGNWARAAVIENGPLRAIFELSYEPWSVGALTVSEKKRFTVDAGRNFDLIESTFTIEGGDGSATVAVGICKPANAQIVAVKKDEQLPSLMVWQTYPTAGSLGLSVFLGAADGFAGFAETETDHLLLVKVKSGDTLRYYAGAGWDRSGDFSDQAAWEKYLADFAARTKAPLRASVAAR